MSKLVSLFSRTAKASKPDRRLHVADVTAEQAAARAADVVLLDVREVDEWTAGHAPGASHVPLAKLVPSTFAGVRVLCVCRSGNRSGMAVTQLRRSGVDASNVLGGMRSWAIAGLPIVTDSGQPGRVA